MATEKWQLKNGNGRNGNRKIGQLEKSAARNDRVGKQDNTKLMCEITATEKNGNGKTATRKMGNGKLGNEKIRQRKLKTEMVGKKGNRILLSEITKTEKGTDWILLTRTVGLTELYLLLYKAKHMVAGCCMLSFCPI